MINGVTNHWDCWGDIFDCLRRGEFHNIEKRKKRKERGELNLVVNSNLSTIPCLASPSLQFIFSSL